MTDSKDANRPLTLVSFIGIGGYQPVDWWSEDGRRLQRADRFLLTVLVHWLRMDHPDRRIEIGLGLTTEAFPQLPKVLASLGAGVLPAIDPEDRGKRWEVSDWLSVTDIPLQKGATSIELWGNFESIVNFVPEKADLVLDITHAFRSIPVQATAVADYLTARRDVTVRHVFYGAFDVGEKGKKGADVLHRFRKDRGIDEALPSDCGHLPEPPPMPPPRTPTNEITVAPVFDLRQLVDLTAWTAALRHYKHTGSPTELGMLAGRTRETSVLSGQLIKLGQQLELGRILEAGRVAGSFQDPSEVDDSSLPKPIKDIVKEALAIGSAIRLPKMKRTSKHVLDASLGLLDHYLMHGRWFPFAALCRESYVSAVMEAEGMEVANRKQRLATERRWLGTPGYLLLHDARFSGKLGANSPARRFLDQWNRLTQIRNDLMHSGFSGSSIKELDSIIEKLIEAFKTLREMRSDPTGLKAVTDAIRSASHTEGRIFLNLSNHPSSAWSDEQRRVAQAFAPEITDLPFPPVDPAASEDEVADLADRTMEAIPGDTTHAMVSGDFSLTWHLVARMQAKGIRCFSATTARDIVEEEAGIKTSRFQFVRFREFPGRPA